MKSQTLLVALMVIMLGFTAQSSKAQTKEEQKLLTTLYYDFDEVHAKSVELAKLNDVIKLLVGDQSLKVKIEGYGDKFGGEQVNQRVSLARAKSTAEYMIRHGVGVAQISFVGNGVDSKASSNADARRVDVSEVITVVIKPVEKPKKQQPAPKPRPADKPKTTEETAEKRPVAEITEPQVVVATDDGLSIRTNMLYWLGGNINFGVEFKSNDIGFVVNAGYSPFEKTEWNHNLGGWFIAPELRYYIGEKEVWFVGIQGLISEYNYKMSDKGFIGDVVGGGLMGGYRLVLGNRCDMDFSLGLGYGTFNYDTYEKSEGNKNVYIDKGLTKDMFMPIQAGVSLIFKL